MISLLSLLTINVQNWVLVVVQISVKRQCLCGRAWLNWSSLICRLLFNYLRRTKCTSGPAIIVTQIMSRVRCIHGIPKTSSPVTCSTSRQHNPVNKKIADTGPMARFNFLMPMPCSYHPLKQDRFRFGCISIPLVLKNRHFPSALAHSLG